MLLLTTQYSFSRNKRIFILYRDKVFQVGEHFFVVFKGYGFDGASVPRPLWWLFAPHGKAFEAACLHDWLYDTNKDRNLNRKEVDIIFLHHMKMDRVPWIQRWVFYYVVRLRGKRYWTLDIKMVDRSF